MSTQFPNRRWLIIPSTQIEAIDFNQVHQTSIDTLRYSLDGTKTFIKYDITEVAEDIVTDHVSVETGQTLTHTTLAGVYGRPSIWQDTLTEYTHAEILEILATGEWAAPLTEGPSPSNPT